jgi:SAM-dependent methyltransferase
MEADAQETSLPRYFEKRLTTVQATTARDMSLDLAPEPPVLVRRDAGNELQLPLRMTRVGCCICEDDDAEPCAVGEDFEYRTSPDSFVAMRCRCCGLIYLNPRPDISELPQIYPQNYHAFDFSPARFGLVYKVRQWLEGRRLVSWCRGLRPDARILDVGCGDGFHLELLARYGQRTWRLEGIDMSPEAASRARQKGLHVHEGRVETLELSPASYDLVLLIQTIEHVADPVGTLSAIRSLLRPGGKVVIVTDNTQSLDARLFLGRHWGGYHFPRHWNLFKPSAMRRLADKLDLQVESIATQVSPVNWVYSVRNLLVDLGAPRWLIERFSLRSPLSLAFFTLLDSCLSLVGKGALLRAKLRRPA